MRGMVQSSLVARMSTTFEIRWFSLEYSGRIPGFLFRFPTGNVDRAIGKHFSETLIDTLSTGF